MFSRIGRLFRGFLGLFISGIEESNPEALMEAARQDFRQKMTQYNLALAKMAGVAERLKSQVKSKADRAQELERRILANHRAGNMDLVAVKECTDVRFLPERFRTLTPEEIEGRIDELRRFV